MNKVKAFLGNARNKIAAVAVASVSALAMSVGASAVDTSENMSFAQAADEIIGQFSDAANSITPVIIGILGAGLGIFVIFVGIKLGKKMFTTVSK